MQRDDYLDDDLTFEQFEAESKQLEAKEAAARPRELSKQPMFQTLFAQIVEPDDTILGDFVQFVVGPLSEHFAVSAAKGGAFFCEKEAEGAKNAERYSRDQSLRAHLINGMLPALRVARRLKEWGAPKLRDWDETAERLFIAGYMLHDFTKIADVKAKLKAKGFAEMEAPSARQIPVLERIFTEWCELLGLDAFLQNVGGLETHLHNLIYVACNTQRYSGTIHAPGLLPKAHPDSVVYERATNISYLADLIAYVARTPRDVVAHKRISDLLKSLSFDRTTGEIYARFVYHHVAENRGVLLNLIHNAALQALEVDGREALLYAPSGVVYLERFDAPPMPTTHELIPQIVREIRQRAGEKLIATGKGARRGNVCLQMDESYNDYFDLPTLIRQSVRLVEKYIVNNKSGARLAPVRDKGWAGGDNIPTLPEDKRDARVDQIAEWAGFIDMQLRDRFGEFDLGSWLLPRLGIGDLLLEFRALENDPGAKKGGGIKHWWFWAAAHALDRQPKDPQATLDWIAALSDELAAALPADLPAAAQVDETKWDDLADYLARVLTLGGVKAAPFAADQELAHYIQSKGKRGKAVCAICGETYTTTKPKETAVAFQPGVYTARVKLGFGDSSRSLCSICALEHLLRQLFVFNLDSGRTAEGQRVRYLTFYPTYFFTPETMRLMQHVYANLMDVRLSESSLRRAIGDAELRDSRFWQRLDEFLLRPPDADPSKRVLRYVPELHPTFFMAGFREFRDPTDTESWILPALFALVLPVCLDVKVVASESSTPLLVEADELSETVWLEGAHPAITDLLQGSRLRIDSLMPALARLAAAYMIHLDTEYAPPKENFHRFAPIAHALMESPFYVFYYLKRQERDDHPIGIDRVRRYVSYAESIFSPEGDQTMTLARKLVEEYRGFYRARTPLNGNRMRRPLDVVAETLLKADQRLFDTPEALTELAEAELKRFMARIGEGKADGRFPKGVSRDEREQAMHQFSETFVNDVFIGIFSGDVAALRGKQLNLLSSTCESLYETMQREEWAARGQDVDTDAPEDDPDSN